MKELKDYVTTIPNFPKEGIMFRDVTSVIEDKDGLKLAIDSITEKLEDVGFNKVMAPESRGFIFGMPVAYNLGKGFVPVRKKGKLPRETISEDYALEYGTATLEIHKDSLKPGDKVVIIDDLIATGGTLEAIIRLARRSGAQVVKVVSLIELVDFRVREKIPDVQIESVIKYEGE